MLIAAPLLDGKTGNGRRARIEPELNQSGLRSLGAAEPVKERVRQILCVCFGKDLEGNKVAVAVPADCDIIGENGEPLVQRLDDEMPYTVLLSKLLRGAGLRALRKRDDSRY